uniref:Uncharacterized protein n=1 Tax=Rhizophora mucronata TaxID=61149 RepID=A0A2P2R0B0_RHIMU
MRKWRFKWLVNNLSREEKP